jgi:hypothetical protein
MTAEHNEIGNGLYSLLSARSFKYAPQCILREKQNPSIVSRQPPAPAPASLNAMLSERHFSSPFGLFEGHSILC